MSEDHLFGNRYRIPSTRLQGHDYATVGSYFITICTHKRETWFGQVRDQMMHLSNIGKIVDECWNQIPMHYPHVTVDNFVIMPNHMHGIVVIGETKNLNISDVETPYRASLQTTNTDSHHKPQWQSGCLGVIINRFKGSCTRQIRNTGHADFAWQPRFHDHIIRGDDDADRICAYIRKNPEAWEKDDFYC